MQFVKKAKKNFLVEEIFDEDRPVFSRQSLFLFTFRKKAPKSTHQTGRTEQGAKSTDELRNSGQQESSQETAGHALVNTAAPPAHEM